MTRITRAVLFALVLGELFVVGAWGQTINAASCSANDVAAALSKVTADGTIVVIPACSSGVGWGAQAAFNPGGNGNVSVDANGQLTYYLGYSTEIRGQGSTTGSDSLGNPTGYNDQTVLIYNNPAGTSLLHPQWSTNGKYFRLSGVTTKGGTGVPGNGSFNLFGVTTQGSNCTWPAGSDGGLSSPVTGPCLRIDHNHFSGLIKPVVVSGWLYGVIDHNVFDESVADTNGIVFWMGGYGNDSAGLGNGSWNDVENYGTYKFVIAENNTFNSLYAGSGALTATGDCMQGGRFVLRHNTINGHMITQTHRDVGDYRSCRAYEIYGNVADAYNDPVSSSQGPFYTFTVMRNGDGMIWGNNVSNFGALTNFVYDRSGTSGQTFPQPPNGYGYCGNNSTTNGLGQPGTSAWDQNSNTSSGYPCFDQTGRGKGDLLAGLFPNKCDQTTGCTTYNGTWPNEALSPVYIWGNATNNVVTSYAASTYNNNQILENRDYFLQLPNINESSTFNGTAGVGCGAGASAGSATSTCASPVVQPATCINSNYSGSLPGPAYWNTANNTLYVCTATNTWTAYYTPYVYPHPLVASGSGTGGNLSPPTNLVATPN
jgi:hypothetical protein